MPIPTIIAIVVAISLPAVAGVFFWRKKKKGTSQFSLLFAPTPAGGVASRLKGVLGSSALGGAFWCDLEAALVEADVGAPMTSKLLAAARGGKSPEDVRRTLAEQMRALFPAPAVAEHAKPRVILVLGVNGAGKTTSIAKLARRLQREGQKVLLVAADTFRAAAIDQLKIWGERLGLSVVAQSPGSDAAAVAFDGVSKGRAEGYDAVLIDTAGRLHTKGGLMEELSKVARVAGRALPGAPHERLFVLDATVGSNGLAQAREFHRAVNLTGVLVAKLDGTAKGGVICAIAREKPVPIYFIGVGEKLEDLETFDAREFAQALLA